MLVHLKVEWPLQLLIPRTIVCENKKTLRTTIPQFEANIIDFPIYVTKYLLKKLTLFQLY